jgi:hypothetical protein
MRVYSNANLAVVGHFRNVLQSHGIACEIRGENRSVGVGEIPPIECWPELWVTDESQLEQAIQIISEAMESDEIVLDAWKCPGCHEENEGQFTECWNCGTSRPDIQGA